MFPAVAGFSPVVVREQRQLERPKLSVSNPYLQNIATDPDDDDISYWENDKNFDQYGRRKRRKFVQHFFEDDGTFPTIEEAQASANRYKGPDIKDPLEYHPNDLPVYENFTCEDFKVYYDEGGHKPWYTTVDVVMGIRKVNEEKEQLRRDVHVDHLFWACETLHLFETR